MSYGIDDFKRDQAMDLAEVEQMVKKTKKRMEMNWKVIKEGVYEIHSESDETKAYLVEEKKGEMRCTCKSFIIQGNNPCKHITAITTSLAKNTTNIDKNTTNIVKKESD